MKTCGTWRKGDGRGGRPPAAGGFFTPAVLSAFLAIAWGPAGRAAEPEPGAKPARAAPAAVAAVAPDDIPSSAGRFFRLPQFIRGDANADGTLDISDPRFLLNFLFLAGPAPPCENAADANGDTALDISDAVFLLSFLFRGGAAPPAPGTRCGVDRNPSALGCASYNHCPDDLPLIVHVLNRVTFGPTEELLTRIQTRVDLLRYLEEQLSPPEPFDQALAEPDLHAEIEALEIGFDPEGTPPGMVERLKGMLLLDAVHSRWQLLQVLARFWNNHFHTQIDALRQNFFSRGGRGGPAARPTPEIFAAADADGDGALVEAEWNAFRENHPGVVPWEFFARLARDGSVSEDEFLGVQAVAFWKYPRARDQFGIAAELERREYRVFRRLAFGRFKDLLRASAQSPAMLIYLNGFENTAAAPNENYAREYFELFALGADHVYTQRDIEEFAKVLTGWSAGWVERAEYPPDDWNFTSRPWSQQFPINLREPPPFRFPQALFWEDDLYTWAFVIGRIRRGGPDLGTHDWGRKDLFLERYGGVDSLGNPTGPAAAVQIAANDTNRTVEAALEEFEQVHERVTSFRDCAKFISTKLIQLFVTDDLSRLAKTRPMPPDLRALFDAADLDGDGAIEREEWEEPIPLVLPNGRPPEIFDSLDADDDGRITPLEYQEPDLLLDAIDTWRRTDGEIREVLRTILFSDEFLSLRHYRAKVKDPFELVTSAVRALGGSWRPEELAATVRDLELAGQELFSFADPTGESELGFDWMHTVGLLERIKYVSRGANPASPAERRFTWDPAALRARWRLSSAERTVDYLTLLLAGGDLPETHRLLAQEAYRAGGANPIGAAAAYILSLPEFQKQ